MNARGHNGQLELTDSVVRIKRKGALAFLTQGVKGDKEILITQVSSIEFRNATRLTNGYIEIGFKGGREAKGGILQGTRDENTVMFRISQQKSFEAFRDALQEKMTAPSAQRSQSSRLDDLEKLASLRDKGIISESDFQNKKRQILGL